jgi:hypothetical protein
MNSCLRWKEISSTLCESRLFIRGPANESSAVLRCRLS